jgi:hypothetical protein
LDLQVEGAISTAWAVTDCAFFIANLNGRRRTEIGEATVEIEQKTT